MPLGRLYQAPTTVARNTPVFGYNGLKSVSNSDLVITGQAVRAKKSKSPSPGAGANGRSAGSSPSKGATPHGTTTGSSNGPKTSSPPPPPRQNGTRKSPSPGVRGASRSNNGITPKARMKGVQAAGKESKAQKENKTNNNNPSSGEFGEVDNPKREKSWSPEEGGENGENDDEKGENDNERVRVGAERLKISEDKVLHNGNPRSQASPYVGKTKKNKG